MPHVRPIAVGAFAILLQCEIFASSGFRLLPYGAGMPFSRGCSVFCAFYYLWGVSEPRAHSAELVAKQELVLGPGMLCVPLHRTGTTGISPGPGMQSVTRCPGRTWDVLRRGGVLGCGDGCTGLKVLREAPSPGLPMSLPLPGWPQPLRSWPSPSLDFTSFAHFLQTRELENIISAKGWGEGTGQWEPSS